jgi:hypothetical protein
MARMCLSHSAYSILCVKVVSDVTPPPPMAYTSNCDHCICAAMEAHQSMLLMCVLFFCDSILLHEAQSAN